MTPTEFCETRLLPAVMLFGLGIVCALPWHDTEPAAAQEFRVAIECYDMSGEVWEAPIYAGYEQKNNTN